MERRPWFWLIVRVSLIALSAPYGVLMRQTMRDDFSSPPAWYVPFVLIGFSLFGVLMLSLIHSDKEWTSPSWRANPIDMERPLESFHVTAWCCLSCALALLLMNVFHAQHDWAWVLPSGIGLGMLLGIGLASIPIVTRR